MSGSRVGIMISQGMSGEEYWRRYEEAGRGRRGEGAGRSDRAYEQYEALKQRNEGRRMEGEGRDVAV